LAKEHETVAEHSRASNAEIKRHGCRSGPHRQSDGGQHRKYQDMGAEKTATVADIQRGAREFEILMTYKMLLEEQLTKYTD
jgi:hypothetical protein